MAHIDYYFSTISPFTYLAGGRLEEISGRYGAEITYKPLDIMQLFERTGGLPPAKRHPSRNAYRAQELPRWAEYLNMPINTKPAFFPVNTAPSSYAVIAAQQTGGDVGELVQAFLRAVWVKERDISDDTVIRDILKTNGFDPDLADKGLLSGAETYARNLEDAVNHGVFGAPFYILRETGQRFWGQDRLDLLDRHLSSL